MKIELFANNTDNFPWGAVILWTIIWVAVLARILGRKDLDVHHKLLWTVVVIFVPFFGIGLYWFLAPDSAPSGKKITVIAQSDVSGTPWANNPNYRTE